MKEILLVGLIKFCVTATFEDLLRLLCRLWLMEKKFCGEEFLQKEIGVNLLKLNFEGFLISEV
jgi:hypothetical protein